MSPQCTGAQDRRLTLPPREALSVHAAAGKGPGRRTEIDMPYTVSQVARMTRLSVRALHHYDEIGLLVPSARTEAGYRLYGDRDLERLQQILFFRELAFPLEEIARILDDPKFDRRAALLSQRAMLQERAAQAGALIAAVDRALEALDGGAPL